MLEIWIGNSETTTKIYTRLEIRIAKLNKQWEICIGNSEDVPAPQNKTIITNAYCKLRKKGNDERCACTPEKKKNKTVGSTACKIKKTIVNIGLETQKATIRCVCSPGKLRTYWETRVTQLTNMLVQDVGNMCLHQDK